MPDHLDQVKGQAWSKTATNDLCWNPLKKSLYQSKTKSSRTVSRFKLKRNNRCQLSTNHTFQKDSRKPMLCHYYSCRRYVLYLYSHLVATFEAFQKRNLPLIMSRYCNFNERRQRQKYSQFFQTLNLCLIFLIHNKTKISKLNNNQTHYKQV